MNISNTISYDSTYSKNDLAERSIEQKIPQISEQNNFNVKLTNLEQEDNKTSIENIQDAVDKSNKSLQMFERKLDISIHDKTSRVMVKVVDTSNDEIIREIPAEQVLDNLANIKEMLGVLMDKKI